jgi:hypothetical protein
MFHLSTYIVVRYFLAYLTRLNLLLIEWVTKMRPRSNSVEDHPQLSHNGHPVDGALVGAGLLWPPYSHGDCITLLKTSNLERCESTT